MQIMNDIGHAAAAAATGASGAAAASSGAASTAAGSAGSMANEQTFLQLLVAQIQNQDPLSPTDSMQFVSQLAQFSSLEQLIGIHQSIDSLNTHMASTTATNASSSK